MPGTWVFTFSSWPQKRRGRTPCPVWGAWCPPQCSCFCTLFTFYSFVLLSFVMPSCRLAWGLTLTSWDHEAHCKDKKAAPAPPHQESEEKKMKGEDPIPKKSSAVGSDNCTRQLGGSEMRVFSKQIWSHWGFFQGKLKKNFSSLTFSV